MSVPHGTVPLGNFETSVPKQKFHEKPMNWFKEGMGDISNGMNKVCSFVILGGSFAVFGGGLVGWYGYQFMTAQMNEKVLQYERKIQVVSFKTFADELGKIDPEEKKSFETTKVLCSDGFINSNPEADMKQVCVNEYYGRKRRNRSKIAQVEE